jgi:hypothetical protein
VYSYWLLLVNGLDLPTERNVAAGALLWHGFYGRGESGLLMFQPSDEYFAGLAGRLEAKAFPSLILSNGPQFSSHIKFGPSVLAKMESEPEGLRRFFTRVHIQLKNGMTLEDLRRQLFAGEFWEWAKTAARELKDIVPTIVPTILGS